MTDNERIAERIQNIIDTYDSSDSDLIEELCELRNELDPPRPEPGTVVWWRYPHMSTWEIAKVHQTGISLLGIYNLRGDFVPMINVQYKPAHIPGPNQVAVDVPPVSEWPYDINSIAWIMIPLSKRTTDRIIITRAEAESMEAVND